MLTNAQMAFQGVAITMINNGIPLVPNYILSCINAAKISKRAAKLRFNKNHIDCGLNFLYDLAIFLPKENGKTIKNFVKEARVSLLTQ